MPVPINVMACIVDSVPHRIMMVMASMVMMSVVNLSLGGLARERSGHDRRKCQLV